MSLLTCVMAWGADAHVSTIDDLKTAVANTDVTTIYLDADITSGYAGTTVGSQINITRSLTIDGQGHTLSGYGKRNSSGVKNTISITGASMVDVTIKNLNIENPATDNCRPLETRGNISSLTLENVSITANNAASGNSQGITIGGNQSTPAVLNFTNTTVTVNWSSYCFITFNPVTIHAEGCTFNGWCSFYFKGASGSEGSHGSSLIANNCTLNNPNYHTGASNGFGAIVLEDDGITISVTNSSIVATNTASEAPQSGVILSSSTASELNEETVVNIDEATQNNYTSGSEGSILDMGNNWENAIVSGAVEVTSSTLPIPLRDGLTNGKMGTLCVAKSLTNVAGAKFYTVSYVEYNCGEPWHLFFDEKEDHTTLEAGVPYVFIANAEMITGDFVDETPVTGLVEAGNMAGNLLSYAVRIDNTEHDPYYVVKDNRFYKMGTNVTLPVGRAFIDLTNVPDSDPTAGDPAFAPRRICLTNGHNAPTGIEETNAAMTATKVIRNGQVLILRDGQLFDVTGRVIE